MSKDIRQHMALTERALAAAFVAHKLCVHLRGNVQGAHALTFGLSLYEPTQKNITRALSLSAALEAAIADSPVRIYTDRGLICVETPSPAPVLVDGARLQGKAFAVPLGMTSRQGVAGVDLIANPHLLLVGPTNRGKTTAARLSLITSPARTHPAAPGLSSQLSNRRTGKRSVRSPIPSPSSPIQANPPKWPATWWM